MRYENMDVRKKMAKYGVTGKEIAKQIGISNVTLSTWMGRMLSMDQKDRINKAIDELRGKQ